MRVHGGRRAADRARRLWDTHRRADRTRRLWDTHQRADRTRRLWDARRRNHRSAWCVGRRRRHDASRFGPGQDVRAMAGWCGERRLWKARLVGDLLRGRDALRGGGEPRTTAPAEPGIRCVLGAAARATHPVASVTYLDRPRLITSRDLSDPGDTLAGSARNIGTSPSAIYLGLSLSESILEPLAMTNSRPNASKRTLGVVLVVLGPLGYSKQSFTIEASGGTRHGHRRIPLLIPATRCVLVFAGHESRRRP
jgi:hypothetical protein